MKTKSKKVEVKKSGLVVLYYNGEPITIQCPNSEKLSRFLLDLSLSLSDAAEYNLELGYPHIANSDVDLKNIIKVAELNIALL